MYKTYKEVLAAYNSGELNRENDIMFLDNDMITVEKLLTVDENDSQHETVFIGKGYDDLKELAILAGFPAEWV